MKLARVAIGWAGVAAIAAATRLLVERIDRGARRAEPAHESSHLASQRCEGALLSLELIADPLELHGTLQATVQGGAPFRRLNAIADPDVEIVAGELDGAALSETAPWLDSLIATPRAARSLICSQRSRTPSANVVLQFRRALSGAAAEDDPLPFVCDPTALVAVAGDMELSSVEVVVPDGLALLTSAATPDALVERGPGRHALGIWGRDHAPLLIGRVARRSAAAVFGTVTYVGAEQDVPSAALESKARELLARAGAQMDGPPRTLLLRGARKDLEPGAVASLGGGWFEALAPREPRDLVCLLVASALAAGAPRHADPLEDSLIAALPAAIALQGAGGDEADAGLPAFARAPAVAPGLRAWRALEAALGERARAAARELYERCLAAAEPAQPELLADGAARSVAQWALAGVDLELERWRLEMTQGGIVASGEVVVSPPPPASAMLALTIWFVGKERIRKERLLLSGARARFDSLELSEPPIEIALDPEGWLPSRRPDATIVPLEVRPHAFAVAPDASSLAVALTRGGKQPIDGVSILRADPEGELAFARWHATDEPVRALDWALPGRYLALARAAGSMQLLDVEDGALLPFEGELLVAPRRACVVESSERAPGSFSHTLHDLSAGLSWPLPLARRGPVDWVAGGDELVVAGSEGCATIVDRRGRTRVVLPLLLRSLRSLRHEPVGFVAAIDTATGGRVIVFDLQGVTVRSIEVPGRVRSVSWSGETATILIGAQSGPHEHVVLRAGFDDRAPATPIYRGADRPLPGAASRRGLLLVDAASDEAPPPEPRRLRFIAFESLARDEGERAARVVSAEAFLDPPPVLASAGRYLYYLRARGGPRALRGELRPRALYRYDFLTGREEPLEIAGR